MKSRIFEFVLGIFTYLFYLFSSVFAALFLLFCEWLKQLVEKRKTDSYSEILEKVIDNESSLILVVSYIVMIMVISCVIKHRKKRVGTYLGLSYVYPIGIFGAVILGALLNLITVLVVSPNQSEKELNIIFFICVLAGPFVEEIVFRGLLLKFFGKACGMLFATLITSFLFAISHSDMTQMLYVFILSIILCIIRIRSRSLWNAVAVHLAFNVSGLVLATSEVELPDVAFLALPILVILSFLLAASGGGKKKIKGKKI